MEKAQAPLRVDEIGRRCTKCGEEKAAEAFYRRSDKKGFRSQCRECLRRTDGQRSRRRALHAEYPEKAVYSRMIQRCYNEKNPAFQDYGARGIRVVDRWLESFDNFLEDMGPRPSAKHSIERKNNDGPYAAWNCVWATDLEQNRNTRQNVVLTVNGKSQCLSQWAEDMGVSRTLIRDRLRLGWSHSDAVLIPEKTIRHGLTACGETHTVAEWARRSGLTAPAIYERLKRGWPADRAVNVPLRGSI